MNIKKKLAGLPQPAYIYTKTYIMQQPLIYMKVQDGCTIDHYTINNEVADHVQEDTVDRILSYHSPDAIVDFFSDSKYTQLL